MRKENAPRRSRRAAPESASGPAPARRPQRAVGLLELRTYTAAIQAADAAAKAASIEVIGYQLTRGGGWVCVKIEGEVAAVQAAVAAGAEWAGRVNQVVAAHVIPRPDEETDALIRSKATVGLSGPDTRGSR